MVVLGSDHDPAASGGRFLSLRFAANRVPSRSKRLQVLCQVISFRITQAQLEVIVVMVNDVRQSRKAAVVVEASFRVRPQPLERRGAIVFVRRAQGLEIINADLGS